MSPGLPDPRRFVPRRLCPQLTPPLRPAPLTNPRTAPPKSPGDIMPHFNPTPDLQLHYRIDDFTDPWRLPGTILLLHGNAESELAWYAWAPILGRHFRVVRPDMRGFGQS